jgi:hypothetical protein
VPETLRTFVCRIQNRYRSKWPSSSTRPDTSKVWDELRSSHRPNHLARVTQVRHVFLLFHILLRDSDHIVAGTQQICHYDTWCGEESEQFLRIGYLLRLGTITRFRQFAPERV